MKKYIRFCQKISKNVIKITLISDTKEFEVLKLYFLGNSTKETAMELYISTRTVEKHLENILSKTACLHFKELRRALFRCPLFYNFFCHDKKQESLGHFKY